MPEEMDMFSRITQMDLRNAFHLVQIREGDEWNPAFNTPSGHYEYLLMQFGLTKPSRIPMSCE